MIIIISVLFVCIILSTIIINYINIFNKIQSYVIRINEAESSIDTILRKRFDLLNKSINIIKNITNEETVLEQIVKLRSRKLSNFDLDRQLYECINEFTSFKSNYKELLKDESFMKIDIGLNESESEIVALRKYYNDLITDYNKVIKKAPSNIVACINKFKVKPYFDGKNMEDNITNDFKL